MASATAVGSRLSVAALARGAATITATAADPAGLEASLNFEVTVPNSSPAPVGDLVDQELELGTEAEVEVASAFADPDGDTLTFRAASSDTVVATVAAAAGLVTVTARARGTATISVTATDPAGLEASLDFEVMVPNSAPAPVGELADLELELGTEAGVDVSAAFADPDGDTLTFHAVSSDTAVATAAAAGGVVTVTARMRGSATVTVTAADPDGLEASRDFEVAVPNSAPSPAGELVDLELEVGTDANVDVAAAFADPDGDALVFGVVSSDTVVARAAVADGVVTLTARARGSATITVTATDPGGLSGSLSFDVVVPNRAPTLTTALPDLTLTAGETHRLVLSRYFSDPDGDPITFSASSSDEARVSLATTGATVRIEANRAGSAQVTVRAEDIQGLSTEASFGVTVTPYVPPPSGFDVAFGWHSSVSASTRGAIRQAVSTWEGILANTELSDVRFDRQITCGNFTTTEAVGVVDDLLIFFAVTSIDGEGGTLGYAGPCYIRSGSWLPSVGRVVLDSDDLPRLSAAAMQSLVLHEVAHVLGFGLLWDVTNPSEGTADPATVDTHFPGPNAIAAFNAAGGASYTGGKVPVQNVDPGPDAHWRYSMFAGELMAPSISAQTGSALSAITIEALADLGYAVSGGFADPFTVALPDRAPGPLPAAEAGRMLELGDDILRIPIRVVDENGRVVRVIPPR